MEREERDGNHLAGAQGMLPGRGRTAGCGGAQLELRMKLRKCIFRFTSRKSIQLGNSIRVQPVFPGGDAGREKPGTEAFEMRLSARSIL